MLNLLLQSNIHHNFLPLGIVSFRNDCVTTFLCVIDFFISPCNYIYSYFVYLKPVLFSAFKFMMLIASLVNCLFFGYISIIISIFVLNCILYNIETVKTGFYKTSISPVYNLQPFYFLTF